MSIYGHSCTPSCKDKDLQSAFSTVMWKWQSMRDEAIKWFRDHGIEIDDSKGGERIGPFEISIIGEHPVVYWDVTFAARMVIFPGFSGEYSNDYVNGRIDDLLEEVYSMKSLLKRQKLYDLIKK